MEEELWATIENPPVSVRMLRTSVVYISTLREIWRPPSSDFWFKTEKDKSFIRWDYNSNQSHLLVRCHQSLNLVWIWPGWIVWDVLLQKCPVQWPCNDLYCNLRLWLQSFGSWSWKWGYEICMRLYEICDKFKMLQLNRNLKENRTVRDTIKTLPKMRRDI